MTEFFFDETMRIASLNVRSLTRKLGTALESAHLTVLLPLAIQPNELVGNPFSALQALLLLTTHTLKRVLSRWPAEQVQLPQNPLFHGRLLAIKVHRPGARPCLLLNCYLHASDSQLAAETAAAAFEWAAATGEQRAIIGDLNLPKNSGLWALL